MSFRVRKATPADVPYLRELVVENHVTNPKLDQNTGFLVYDTSVKQIEACDFPYVAETTDGRIGFLLVYSPEADRGAFGKTFEKTWNAHFYPNWFHAHQIAVKEGYTGQGVGRRLWEMAEEEGRSREIDAFYAEIPLIPTNLRSQSVHGARGWRKIKERVQENAYFENGQGKTVRWGLYTKKI